MSRIALFVATAGYAGFTPFAPGTVGSMVGLALYIALRWADSAALETAALILSLLGGMWAAGVAEKELGKDPGPVVIDEVHGMLVTVAFLNVTPLGAFVGFVLFRLYDVIKPYPAGRLEHLHGGPGIMLDDLMAGVYSNLTLRALIALFPGIFA